MATLIEKVKVKSCSVKKSGEKNGKKWTIHEVTLEDGRKGDSFDEMKEGHEYEIEIKPNANPSYNPSFVLQKEQRKNFPQRDYTFEKRRAALEFSVSLACNKLIDAKLIKEQADRFLAYLNEK